MTKQQIGLVGLAVMGENLALNIESRGYSVAVFNRTTSKVTRFIANRCQGKDAVGCYSPQELCASLQRPRKIILMVKAGEAVDAMIGKIRPYLDRGDLLIDGGNSHFRDTERRLDDLAADGILYIGTGVSGGEEGALEGPCIMPGGSKKAYQLVKGILEKAAAQVDGPCCTYIGDRGAGHFVKMVHNGIEYGIMQAIAEVYHVLGAFACMTPEEISETFANWNRGEFGGYLTEITVECLARTDEETGQPLVDVILDKAGQKGTGKWTSQAAMDVGVAVPTIDMAVEARILSAFKDEREAASRVLKGPRVYRPANRTQFSNRCRDALYGAVVCSYAQGMVMLRAASKEYDYDLALPEIARIWKGGCIIRSKLLDPIAEAYRADPALPNLLVAPHFAKQINRRVRPMRHVVSEAVAAGIPMLALASALGYIDSYRTARLPQNLTQAQRDYFGAHTYQRIDKDGSFHTQWTE